MNCVTAYIIALFSHVQDLHVHKQMLKNVI
jgi:hypothetical protein